MSDVLAIQSHTGLYYASFDCHGIERLNAAPPADTHVIIDARVADLYHDQLAAVLAVGSVLRVDAHEASKGLEAFPDYVAHLVTHGIRRDHTLTAIGGGVIQDITCFLAATLLRGITWQFFPTTLLAQADSCIGSKSSINCGNAKNILGTFTPPRQVVIDTHFLATLDPRDVRSGIGEMLKVHAIEGPAAFAEIAAAYDRLFTDDAEMNRCIRRSLEIKKRFIELDEFDRGPRQVFNYGHSFGHAIEAATNFAIPHGVAVTIGMDMANYLAWMLGRGAESLFRDRHRILQRNYEGSADIPVLLDTFLAALSKDKKNIGAGSVTVILPNAEGLIERVVVAADSEFAGLCRRYFDEIRIA